MATATRSYTIRRAAGPVTLCGDATGPWADADELLIDQFPWFAEGSRQRTAVKALYDEQALYLQFNCEDRFVFAEITELNGNVCLDSCVEFFATCDPAAGPDYFNLEMNCCGMLHLGHGPSRRPRTLATAEQAARITIATSEPGPTRPERSGDAGWWLAARLPLAVVGEMAGKPVAPAPGDRWRGNFFRCGGRRNKQFAQWNPIDTEQWPRPDFHRPEAFGELVFA